MYLQHKNEKAKYVSCVFKFKFNLEFSTLNHKKLIKKFETLLSGEESQVWLWFALVKASCEAVPLLF